MPPHAPSLLLLSLRSDIKPENIFLTHTRILKVLDFGVAQLRSGEEDVAPTAMGTVLGTVAFMPPEQARGDREAISVQSDLWSVAATMFTLLSTDRRPPPAGPGTRPPR